MSLNWLDYVKGLVYLLVGYIFNWISTAIPGIAIAGPWLSTFFGVVGIGGVIAGAVKVFDTFMEQLKFNKTFTEVGEILVAFGLLYSFPPVNALGPIPFAAIVFAFLLAKFLKK